MRRALAIVCKAPRPGQAKTRLAPPLTFEEAASLAGAFLLDTVALGLSLSWDSVVVMHPREDGALLRPMLPRGVQVCQQRQAGLGAALREAFERCFKQGHQRVVLIDSDSPTLPLSILRDACAGLEEHDLAIGPSADGGYYLLGMREPRLQLFDGIAWSTSSVYAQTLERAAGLKVLSLDEWYDVDTAEDLARLEADLAHQPATTAPNTRAVMERVRLHATG